VRRFSSWPTAPVGGIARLRARAGRSASTTSWSTAAQQTTRPTIASSARRRSGRCGGAGIANRRHVNDSRARSDPGSRGCCWPLHDRRGNLQADQNGTRCLSPQRTKLSRLEPTSRAPAGLTSRLDGFVVPNARVRAREHRTKAGGWDEGSWSGDWYCGSVAQWVPRYPTATRPNSSASNNGTNCTRTTSLQSRPRSSYWQS
jgi:hypothetical protein